MTGYGNLRGKVFEDRNADGLLTGDPLIGDVTVQLIDWDTKEVVGTTTTNALTGEYFFGNVEAGRYKVKFVNPAPEVYSFSPRKAGSNKNIDSDGPLSDVFRIFEGKTRRHIDAGLFKKGVIGDFVWEDVDRDGFQDRTEKGIAGVKVRLFNDEGEQIRQTSTNANGRYRFRNLRPGDYRVVFDGKEGYQFSPFQSIDNLRRDSDGPISNVIRLRSGDRKLSVDAGLFKSSNNLASVGDFVWEDLDQDGFQDVNENGVAGVEIQLLNTSGDVVDSTTTAANGFYLFENVTPADYQVKFQALPGYQFTTANVGDDNFDSDVDPISGTTQKFTLLPGESNRTVDAGLVREDCPTGPIGGIDLGQLTQYLFFFADGSKDANWQGATKGFVGDVAVNGLTAKERTSGDVPYAGTIYTNDTSLDAWQKIADQNSKQASVMTGQQGRIDALDDDLKNAFAQINSLEATAGFEDRSSSSLDGLNTKDGVNQTYVINVTSESKVSSQINISGDAGDVYVLRWDEDLSKEGYQGEVKFQSGGAIVPEGELMAGNFIHVAGDINASGGGSTPSTLAQAPVNDDGILIDGGKEFSGGGFFTGYWLTTGIPGTGETSSLSNAIFQGGWYTLSSKFSMTSGTSGIHICPTHESLRFSVPEVTAG